MTTALKHGASWRYVDPEKQFNEAYKQMFSNLGDTVADEIINRSAPQVLVKAHQAPLLQTRLRKPQ